MSKVYEFGNGKVREHLGGIYEYLRTRNIETLNELNAADVFGTNNTSKPQGAPNDNEAPSIQKISYTEHKEKQKKIRRIQKLIEESEKKISDMEIRLKELDNLLSTPENASDMKLVNEYTSIKKSMDEEEDRWTDLSEEIENLKA